MNTFSSLAIGTPRASSYCDKILDYRAAKITYGAPRRDALNTGRPSIR